MAKELKKANTLKVIDLNISNFIKLDIEENTTTKLIENESVNHFILEIKLIGIYSVTWFNNIVWCDGYKILPYTPSLSVGKNTIISFSKESDKWYAQLISIKDKNCGY